MKSKKTLISLTSFLACNAFVLSGAIVGLSHHKTTNNEESISPVLENASLEENNKVTKLTEQPRTLKEYNEADPKAIAALPKFDARQYDIITTPKNQGSEGLCWAYATAGTAEASILKEGLSDDKDITFSPHGLDYVTNKRKPEFDPLGNNAMDEWGGSKGAGSSQLWSMNALQMWTGPLDQKVYGDNYMQRKPDYFLENAPVLTLNAADDLDKRIQMVKEMVAEFGSVTIDVLMPPGNPGYINTNFSGNRYVGHAIDIIGWDDSINKNWYNNGADPSIRDGGWIVKNSWGATAGPKHDGTAFISYDSSLGALVALDFDKANAKYDNNYYYDAAAKDGIAPDEAYGKPTAVMFKAKKANFDTKETLKAINVGLETPNTDIKVEIYKGSTADFDNPTSDVNNPRSGKLVATQTQHAKYAGYTTIELKTPITLEQDEVFSVIVSLSENGKLYYSNDQSTDNMSFYERIPGHWHNPMTQIWGTSARIKAFTKEEHIPNKTSNSLKDARIELSSQISRIGEPEPTVTSITLAGKPLRPEDYILVLGEMKFTMDSGNISGLRDVVGFRKIKIKGTGSYTGEQEIKHLYRVGTLPDLNGKAWYTDEKDPRDAILHLRVKSSATRYNEIEIPTGFKWLGDETSTINFSNPLTLDYVGENAKYYRRHNFYGRNLELIRMDSDNFKPVPDNINRPEQNNPSIPGPQPPFIEDPELDVKFAKIDLERYEYRYDGKPIEPKVLKVTFPSGAHPRLLNFIISYKDNDKPGIGKVIVKGDFDNTVYYGVQEVPFTILNSDGSKPDLTPPPAPEPTPEFDSIDLNISNYSPIEEGQTISASASVKGSNLKDVHYKWEILGSSTKINSTTANASFVANINDNNRTLRVTATSGLQSIFKDYTLNITRKQQPVVPQEPTLNSVYISCDNRTYKVGEMINANAMVDVRTSSNLRYEWSLDGNIIGTDSWISFPAEANHNNKYLQLKVIQNGITRTNNMMLRVEQPKQEQNGSDSKPVPPVVGDGPNNSGSVPSNGSNPSKPGFGNTGNSIDTSTSLSSTSVDTWIYALIGVGSLTMLIGVILAIVAFKKKNAAKAMKTNSIKQVKVVQVKQIPSKTTNEPSSSNPTIPTFKR